MHNLFVSKKRRLASSRNVCVHCTIDIIARGIGNVFTGARDDHPNYGCARSWSMAMAQRLECDSARNVE